ncbi:MAG: terminase gpA endonuclease subunit [Pseudomonadota bacterium]
MIYMTLGDIVCDAADKMLRPPERLTVSQAAQKYRKLNNPGSYIGDWKNERVPYIVEVMDILGSREYRECIFVGPSQSAKSECILNWLAYTVVCDPADMLIVQMSLAQARDFSMRRVDRLHRDSKDVGAMLGPTSEDNVFDTRYRNGMMVSLSWPSVNELSSKPIGRVALTDYDRMSLNVGGEGTPFALASARTTTFGSFAMTFAESSPGHEVVDPKYLQQTPHEAPPCEGILSLYNGGDRRRWYWPCPHCHEYYEPAFKLLTWDARITNSTEAGESAKMACPHCGALTDAGLKRELNAAGRWVKDGQRITKAGNLRGDVPHNPRASFWLKGPAAAFASWSNLVSATIEAEKEWQQTGSQETLKTVVNTKHGEPYVPRGDDVQRLPEDLKTRSLTWEPQTVPEGVRFLVATTDVQKSNFETTVYGIGPGTGEPGEYTITVVDTFVIQKSERVDEDGDKLWVKPATYLEDWNLLETQIMDREYALADGSGFMGVKLTTCDSGGRDGVTGNAYNFWRALRKRGRDGRFLLTKGEGRPGAPRAVVDYPDTGQKGKYANARGEIPVLFLNTNVLKDYLNGILDSTRATWPDWLPDTFFTQLCSERRGPKGWEKISSKVRNEQLDLITYCLAACLHLGIERIDWKKPPAWAAEWSKNALVRKKEETPKTHEKPARISMAKFAQALA